MIFTPVWVLTLLGAFFQLVGSKALAEIKKEQAREAKKAKAFEARKKALKEKEAILQALEEKQLQKAREEFAKVERSKQVAKDLKKQIAGMRVELDEDPYGIADEREEDAND